MGAEKLHEKVREAESAGIYFQVHVDLGAVVELADRLGIAAMALVLGINFVIDGGRESRETVGAIGADDIGFHRASAGIGEIDNGVGKRVIPRVEHLAEQ